jgi:uncharacterized membrane protein HdeD (DUF308 family)
MDRVTAVLHIVVGVLTVIAGGALIAWPTRSIAVLSVIIGIVLVVVAVVELWTAITARNGNGGSREVRLLVGLLLLVAGVVCLRQPELTIALLMLVLGLAWLTGGVGEIYHATTGVDDRLAGVTAGVVNVIAGIVVLVFPAKSAVGVVWVIGGGLVAVGVVAIVRGIRARSGRHGEA